MLLLDTNIIVTLSRDRRFLQYLAERYRIELFDNELFVSAVVHGEIDSIVKRRKIGRTRSKTIASVIGACTVLGINNTDLIQAYGTLDAYSQGKLTPTNFTARNMGKKISGSPQPPRSMTYRF